MTDDHGAPRSRRALLAAAAGSAAALAASAALPLAAAAHDPDDIQAGADNATTATTSITDSTADSVAFAASAQGTGFGVQASSATGAGVYAWSVSANPSILPADVAYTGAYGWAPTTANPDFLGAGVWGDSEDVGVIGTGDIGMLAIGNVGIWGESIGPDAAVVALAAEPTSLALDVRGKVKFSRSGRATVAKNHSTVTVTLAGVTTSSRVFAVLFTNRTSRYVRAAVPSNGSFRIYLNASVSATTYVSWFVLN
jgi:hypothetical protein